MECRSAGHVVAVMLAVANSTKAVERLFGVKSLDKAIEVQSQYAKTIYEDYTEYQREIHAAFDRLSIVNTDRSLPAAAAQMAFLAGQRWLTPGAVLF